MRIVRGTVLLVRAQVTATKFDPIYKRLPRQGKARQGKVWLAWHGLVQCACVLLSLSHFGGDLPKKVS